jgi:hypothetical protein
MTARTSPRYVRRRRPHKRVGQKAARASAARPPRSSERRNEVVAGSRPSLADMGEAVDACSRIRHTPTCAPAGWTRYAAHTRWLRTHTPTWPLHRRSLPPCDDPGMESSSGVGDPARVARGPGRCRRTSGRAGRGNHHRYRCVRAAEESAVRIWLVTRWGVQTATSVTSRSTNRPTSIIMDATRRTLTPVPARRFIALGLDELDLDARWKRGEYLQIGGR